MLCGWSATQRQRCESTSPHASADGDPGAAALIFVRSSDAYPAGGFISSALLKLLHRR
jgi:hypothetical protein